MSRRVYQASAHRRADASGNVQSATCGQERDQPYLARRLHRLSNARGLQRHDRASLGTTVRSCHVDPTSETRIATGTRRASSRLSSAEDLVKEREDNRIGGIDQVTTADQHRARVGKRVRHHLVRVAEL